MPKTPPYSKEFKVVKAGRLGSGAKCREGAAHRRDDSWRGDGIASYGEPSGRARSCLLG